MRVSESTEIPGRGRREGEEEGERKEGEEEGGRGGGRGEEGGITIVYTAMQPVSLPSRYCFSNSLSFSFSRCSVSFSLSNDNLSNNT